MTGWRLLLLLLCQQLIWLGGGKKTVYNIGTFDRAKGVFLDVNGGVSVKESHDAFRCGQSMSDARGRRVQFGWLRMSGEARGQTPVLLIPWDDGGRWCVCPGCARVVSRSHPRLCREPQGAVGRAAWGGWGRACGQASAHGQETMAA